jgi:hypothetical protein
MRRRPFQIVASLILLAAVISAAGCGGGGSKNTTTTTTTAAAAAPPTTTTTTTTPTPAQSTPATTTSTSSLGGLASVANCKQLANLGEAFSQALQGASGNVQKEMAIFQQFAAKTPSDIRPSFEVIANALSKASSALKGVSAGGTPSAADLAKLSALASTLQGPEVKQAETKIQQWAAANCHG